MYSIHNRSQNEIGTGQMAARRSARFIRVCLLPSVFCLFLAGCQHYAAPKPDTLVTSTIKMDAAMQRRDWSQSTARYEPTAVVSGARGFNYQPKDSLARPRALFEPMLFLGQTLWLPVDLVANPQWEGRTSEGVLVEPTQHAIPTLDVNRESYPN